MNTETVAVEPTYCHHCGTEVDSNTFEGRECSWCPKCDIFLIRKPVPIVQVIVHDDEDILLLNEPVSWKEDELSLPGGHVRHDEGPKEAVLRELQEETDIEARQEDLDFLTILHSEAPDRSWYLITYSVDWNLATENLEAEAEGFEIEIRSRDDVRQDPDIVLPAAFERIQLLFESK